MSMGWQHFWIRTLIYYFPVMKLLRRGTDILTFRYVKRWKPGHHVTKSPSYQVTKLLSDQVTRLLGDHVTRLHGNRVMEEPGNQVTIPRDHVTMCQFFQVHLGVGYLELPQLEFSVNRPMTQQMLRTQRVYLLDSFTDVFVWVGAHSDRYCSYSLPKRVWTYTNLNNQELIKQWNS